MDKPDRTRLDPGVSVVLHGLLEQTRAVLGPRFVGMYLYGSLALGDFNPVHSDIDLLVVAEPVLADIMAPLSAMHARFAGSASPYAARIEAAYVTRAALRSDGPVAARYPQIEQDGTLELAPLESGWVFQCLTLREHGIAVAGPEPRTLIDPVDHQEIRQGVEAITDTWADQARHDPGWLTWLRTRKNQSFVVLTLCRMLYSLAIGDVASKPAAARWARQALGERWAGLLDRALVGQYDAGATAEDDVQETVNLVHLTRQRCR